METRLFHLLMYPDFKYDCSCVYFMINQAEEERYHIFLSLFQSRFFLKIMRPVNCNICNIEEVHVFVKNVLTQHCVNTSLEF